MNNFKYQMDTFFKIANMFDFEIIETPNSKVICVKDDLTLTMTTYKTGNGIACTANLFSQSKNITLGLPYEKRYGGSCHQKQYRLVENYLVSDVSRMIDAIKLCDSDGYMEMEITSWEKDKGFGFAENVYIPKSFINVNQIPIEYRENNMKGFNFRGKCLDNDTRGPKVIEVKSNSGYFNLEALIQKELANDNISKEITEERLFFIVKVLNDEQKKKLAIYSKIYDKSVIEFLQEKYKAARSKQNNSYCHNTDQDIGY